MIGQILQALWQQVAPQVGQFVNSPALPQLGRILLRIPPPFYGGVANEVSANVSSCYDSLTPEDKQRLQDATAWVIKDLSGDALDAIAGLPIGSFVVEKVLAYLGHENNAPEQEKAFIRYELLRQQKV
jgi:hypothetical protein